MSDLHARQERLEVKADELEAKLDDLEEQIQTKTDENDVLVLVNENAKDSKLISQSDLEKLEERMEAKLHESQMKLLKWMVGTGISSVSLVIALIRIFM